MRRILVAVGALLAAVLFLPVPGAVAEDYPSDLATSCQVEVPGAIDGDHIVLDVAVTANSAAQPTGTVALSIKKGSKSVWSDSVVYKGSPIRVTGPHLRPGHYVAKMAFQPASSVYQSCNASVGFGVSPASAGGPGHGSANAGSPGNGIGGLLPNTGGPHLALLLLGLALVVGGGGVVTGSRRLT
ncbi:MAG TPA: hypothetical protein VNS81_04210 [Nocardioides sp.]|nr:hypothetical protein [Nocardioides sp.]